MLWFVANVLYKSLYNFDWQILIFKPFQIWLGFLFVLTAFILFGRSMEYAYRHICLVNLSFIQAFILVSLPSLGKYIPGKMFAVVGHSIIAKKFDIRVSVSAFVNLLISGFGLAGVSLIGLLLLMIMGDSINVANFFSKGGFVFLIVSICITIIYPESFRKLINWGLGILKQPPLLNQLESINMAILFILLLFQSLLYLSGVVIIISGTIELSFSLMTIVVGISCIAYVGGFLAVFAPAGIGVREGIFFVMLAPIVGSETAGLITIMIRLIQTICDCILGVIGLGIMLVYNRTKAKTDTL